MKTRMNQEKSGRSQVGSCHTLSFRIDEKTFRRKIEENIITLLEPPLLKRLLDHIRDHFFSIHIDDQSNSRPQEGDDIDPPGNQVGEDQMMRRLSGPEDLDLFRSNGENH